MTESTCRQEEMACPPKAPNPGADAGLEDQEKENLGHQQDPQLEVMSEDWDLSGVSATSAIRFLIASVQALADFLGDIPPTPPVSRPTTPFDKPVDRLHTPPRPDPRFPLSPVSPLSPLSHNGQLIAPVQMPSPEAHRDEPIPPVEADAEAETVAIQRAVISRRFFLKTVPPFSLSEYLLRLHKYCPHSAGVYLVAASYIWRLCVSDLLVPATTKTVHRLCLAAIRVASKAFDDHKWAQERISKVGGVSKKELMSLEVNLCFLLDFELFVKEVDLKKQIFLLQQAGRQGAAVKRRMSNSFKMRLPPRGNAATTGG